jgi:hypothetical protein
MHDGWVVLNSPPFITFNLVVHSFHIVIGYDWVVGVIKETNDVHRSVNPIWEISP